MALGRFELRTPSLFLLLAVAVVAPARGLDIIVNDMTDALHDPGCAVSGTGTCTLRDAITFANRNPGRDKIYLGGGRTFGDLIAARDYR